MKKVLILFLASACTSGGATDSDTTKETDSTETGTDDTGPTGTDDTGPTGTDDTGTGTGDCAPVTPGDDWAWNGQCPQMRTPVAIAVDACALTLDYGGPGAMTMGMPFAGTVAGDTVTFADDNTVSGCVGTVVDPDAMEGTCGSGCTWTLER